MSRLHGKDSQSCGSRTQPCRTIARGLEIVGQNSRVLVDGSSTKSNPYNCENMTQPIFQRSTAINYSLQITAYDASSYMSCAEYLLIFIGPSSKMEEMKVHFSGFIFVNTSMAFIDSSVSFVNCSFVQSIKPIEMKLAFRQDAALVVDSSGFFSNVGCIRLELFRHKTQVSVNLRNVHFEQNELFSELEGSGISIYSRGEMQNNALIVNLSMIFEDVVFRNNAGPLITNNLSLSESKESYVNVQFLNNHPSARRNATLGKGLYFSTVSKIVIVFDKLKSVGNANTRCIELTPSISVQLKVLNSRISGHKVAAGQPGAGIWIKAVQSVAVLIDKSCFSGNVAGSSGGAVAIQNEDNVSVKLRVTRSNFTENFAQDDGGAFSVVSRQGFVVTDIEKAKFQLCRSNKTGGAFNIFAKETVDFKARHTIWLSCEASESSSVNVATSLNSQQSNTTIKIYACKFICNDASMGDFSVASAVGIIDVSRTEWNYSAQGFLVECDCNVEFTDVHVTGCRNGPAFTVSSPEQFQNHPSVKFRFERCSFLANNGDDIYLSLQITDFQLYLKSIEFDGKQKWKNQGYYAVYVHNTLESVESKIILTDVVVNEMVGALSIVFHFTGTNNKVFINNCSFRHVRSYASEQFNSTAASPLSIIMPDDDFRFNVCSNGSTRSHLAYQYQNTVVIENSSFTDNIGRTSGGVFLDNGFITIRNSFFENNFAIHRGGHIHVDDGSAKVEIENSTFKQSSVDKLFLNERYVHDTSVYSKSAGSLRLQNTTVTTDLEKDSYYLFSVTKAGLVSFDNFTKVQCAVGSALRMDNFSHFIVWPADPESKLKSCKLKITVITLSCHQCPKGMYSLSRGEVTSFQDDSDSPFVSLECSVCPDGANCSRNIFAQPNYWGYADSKHHGRLNFVYCPPHYCTPTGIKQVESLSVYNKCYGNRDGIMCGRCKEGFTETFFSKNCKQKEKCKNHWLWLMLFVYIMTMALFFIHQPPIVEILVRNILWFRKPSIPTIMEYQPLNQRNGGNSGYTKILFYYYQISSYLTLEPLHVTAEKTYFVYFFIGLFNFQTRFPRSSFGCPFPGLTVVTKELTPAVAVVATLFMVQVIFLLHLCFSRWTGGPHPPTPRYYSATLKTLLLGYACLANTSLKLLTCVPVLGESRLYYDGNVRCLTWWQYLFIIFVVAFLLPFVIVIYWGAMKLQRNIISTEHFIAACLCPLGFISFWLVREFVYPPKQLVGISHRAFKKRKEVLKVLHDPFCFPTSRRCGSLYWESVLIGRRFLILSYQVIFPDPLLRMFCMDMTCLLIFVSHVTIKPFRDFKANIIEAGSLLALIVIATINLLQALFLSAGWTPQGHIEKKVEILQHIEFILLGIVPLFLALLFVFAALSQAVRLLVLLYKSLVYAFRKLSRWLFVRRRRPPEYYELLK